MSTLKRLVCWLRDHRWDYFEDREVQYTGYLERCARCGEIVQVPQ